MSAKCDSQAGQCRPVSVKHYENFPVASWLCPPRLRQPIAAIYWFARTADDIADEGQDSRADRAAKLSGFRSELQHIASGAPPSELCPAVFVPLAAAIKAFDLPLVWLDRLLQAFIQDLDNAIPATRAELLAYCALSANPIGRLLLHLNGVKGDNAERLSDSICTSLQLINFWQDLSVDLPRGRSYVAAEDALRHGLNVFEAPQPKVRQTQVLVQELCGWARQLMHEGSDLVHLLPGRAGWELRMVVQGGLRILEKIRRNDHLSWYSRPRLGAWDISVMSARSVGMSLAPVSRSNRT
jgi:squalene synthase HpnC